MPTPQRLPIVNSDDGVWGDILRQYLLKEHYDDGTDNAVNGGHKTITIRPGTASAGTAPLKFTTGTLLTAPEAGAMEFAGDNYYLTDTSGPTRRKIAAYDDTSGATGDIYYRNSSGYFTRLAVGSTGDLLTVSGGIPSWSSSISNASTITLKDINFTLQDNTDTTKQLQFELSGISASTTRTLTVPDANTTIVGTDATQTLTNKTLTSPTVNNIFNNSVRAINFSSAAGAVDYFDVNNATGTVGLRALGTSTNIGITLEPKGNGKTSIYAATGQTPAIAATGADANHSLNLVPKGSGTVQANGVPVVTTTATQTLTNKTLTSPRVNQLLDTNGATGLVIHPTSGAVNYPKIYNDATTWVGYGTDGSATDINLQVLSKGAGSVNIYNGGIYNTRFIKGGGTPVNHVIVTSASTGNTPKINAGGTDANVNLNLAGQGTGVVQANGVPVVTTTATQTLTNKTLTSPKIGTSIFDTNGAKLLDIAAAASAVNYIRIGNRAAGLNPYFLVEGTDTNIDLQFNPKGSGALVFYVTTGQHAKIRADGTDVNHNLNLIPKGTGTVQANGVPVVTTTGAQDLTNKTLTSPTITSPTGNIVTSIDGASGAITGVARRVATTSYTGAVTNQWAKVLTWTASTAYYSQSILMGFVATPGVALTATVLVQFTNNAAGVNPTGNVYMTSLGSDPGRIDANAFKLVGGAYGEPIELWVKQKSYTALAVFEIARYNNGGTLTYLTNDPLQGTEPVGSVINVSTNGVVAGDVPVVTTTGTQTLTNKTLTSPRVNQILDTNGAIALDFSGTPSAANYLWAANAVAADFPKLRALGSATDVSLGFRPKGAGTFRFQAPAGEEALQIVPIASAVNYFRFDSSATGSPLPIWAGGTDTNISINLRPKGTGTVQQNGVPVVTISGTQTLTNKTINASNNTISNLDTADFAANAIVTKSEGISSNDNDTTLPTSAAVKSYVDKGGIVYATTNTAGTYNGQYTPILQVDITAQYTTGRFLARVLTSGAPPPEYVDIDLYIDQYDVLGGSDPTITLKVKNATASTVDEDQFIAVLTTHTGSQSTVTLYVKIDDMWKVWLVQPKFNEFSAGAGTYTWLSNQSYVASLPGGSQSVGVAGEVVINDDKFILQDSSDKTKKLKFELSSISASTTRTLTVPDASGTIALTSDIAAAGGMLAPAQGMTLGSETFTISSGTVTQISGTTINGYTPAIGDRILVANAPATTGTGSSYSMTSQPTNGIYVVTGNTTNLTVSRATDMSGSVKPGGLSVYVQNATWPGSKTVFYVDTPNNLSAFTWGTTNLRFTYAGGPSGKMTQVWVTENALGYNIYNGTGWTYFGATANSGNQDLTLPATATDTIVARTSTDTLTNKTISGASNTITDIPVSALPAKHPVERLNLTSGLTTLPRPNSYTNIGADLASETLLLVYLYPDENRTINDLTLLVREAGGTATLAQLAVFSADGSGNLTSIATTTHDASLVVSAWTTKTKSLSSSVSLVAGSTYAVGLLLVSSNAMPGIGGALGHWDEFALAPRLTGRVYGQTSMPSSVNVGDIQTTSSAMYIRLS